MPSSVGGNAGPRPGGHPEGCVVGPQLHVVLEQLEQAMREVYPAARGSPVMNAILGIIILSCVAVIVAVLWRAARHPASMAKRRDRLRREKLLSLGWPEDIAREATQVALLGYRPTDGREAIADAIQLRGRKRRVYLDTGSVPAGDS